MAEVTREMILEYMQTKGGVVRNVDLVRHFRKYLQLNDPRAKDQARDRFKARVNEVAYIKADNKGEKYLYLKTELSDSSAAPVTTGNQDSALSKRDSAFSILSKRDSAYSILSKRDSAHSILSSDLHSFSGQSYRQGSGQQPPSGRESGHQVTGHSAQHTSTRIRTPPRDSSGHGSSTRSSVQPNSVGSTSGQSLLGQPTSAAAGHLSGQSSKRPTSTANNPPPPSTTTTTSLLGDSLLGDSAFSSFLSGGSGLGGPPATSTSTEVASSTGGGGGADSSFASDIFGSIGGFWSGSGSSGGAGKQARTTAAPSTTALSSSSASSSSRSTTQHSPKKVVGSQVAGSGSVDVTLQSYKPLSSPPHTSTPPSRPPPQPPTRTTRPPSPPAPPQDTRPAPPSRSTQPSPPSRRPPSPPSAPTPSPPAPPRRNPNYTTTYTSTAPSSGSGSVFSPPPQIASSGGDTLLVQMTTQLSSFGEIGSLLDSFGDFSTTTPAMSSSSTSNETTTMSNSIDRSSKMTSLSNSSDRSSGTVVAGREMGGVAAAPSLSQPQRRETPATVSSSTTSAYTSIHSATPTAAPAPSSPVRAPRREPPPPPSSSSSQQQSSLARRGSLDVGRQRHGSQDSSPHIRVQRVDSDAFSIGGAYPPQFAASGDMGGPTRGRMGSVGLPPLPPSAMLAPADPRRPTAATANGGLGVALRSHDRCARDKIQSSVRRSRNLDKSSNLDSLTRASILMTPPSVRRSMQQAPGPGGAMYARPAPGSREDVSLYQGEGGDQDGSLSAPSDEYEIDPIEKEWMLACASADMQEIHSLLMRDSTLINRKGFLHGYTALHWAAKLGRCDFMTALVVNGAFPNIKSNGGFTPLHLACQGGYDNAIAMLVRDHRADVNARDNSGRKPLDMLNYCCPDSIAALLTDKQIGHRPVRRSSDHLPSFSHPRPARHGSLSNNMWTSMPNVLDSADEMYKKRVSPKSTKRTFSFRNRHKMNSPHDKRPRSHIPETYDA